MGQFLLIVLIAAASFAALIVVFAAGRTLHRSEIGRNPAMRERGIRCTAEWMRSLEEECDKQTCEGCGVCSGKLK